MRSAEDVVHVDSTSVRRYIDAVVADPALQEAIRRNPAFQAVLQQTREAVEADHADEASTGELRQRPRRRRSGDAEAAEDCRDAEAEAEAEAEARQRADADERWGSQLEWLHEHELSLPALWEWLRSHPLQAAAVLAAALAMGGAAVIATRRLRSVVGLLRLFVQ